jgi:hypothetical protein
MKILLSWSSGKDSAWALHVLRQTHPGLGVVVLAPVDRAVEGLGDRPPQFGVAFQRPASGGDVADVGERLPGVGGETLRGDPRHVHRLEEHLGVDCGHAPLCA